jgi:hypothetical protein
MAAETSSERLHSLEVPADPVQEHQLRGVAPAIPHGNADAAHLHPSILVSPHRSRIRS